MHWSSLSDKLSSSFGHHDLDSITSLTASDEPSGLHAGEVMGEGAPVVAHRLRKLILPHRSVPLFDHTREHPEVGVGQTGPRADVIHHSLADEFGGALPPHPENSVDLAQQHRRGIVSDCCHDNEVPASLLSQQQTLEV